MIPGSTVAAQFLAHLGSQDAVPVTEEEGYLLGVLTVADLARVSRDMRDRHTPAAGGRGRAAERVGIA